MPELILKYNERHPGVVITVTVSDYVDDTLQRLGRGEIDFLVKLDEGSSDPDFVTIASRPEPLVFVTHPDNPLLSRKKLSLRDTVSHQFITSSREIGYSAILEKRLLEQGIEMEPVMDIGSVEAIVRLLRGGYGVALLPEYVVADLADSGVLARLDVKDPGIKMSSYYLRCKDRWINPAMREFILLLQD